jgi:RimJ/RimL family protein N-acetyltransferase
MISQLETRRLILRPLALDDAEHMQRIFPRWEIVRYLAARVPWPYPPDGSLTYIRDVALPAMARGEEWHWTLRLKADPALHIGCISLMTTRAGNRGFWIVPAYQRQGLMTEAADAVTDFWFETLGFPEIRVAKAIENTGSRRISEKNGMRMIAREERDYVCGRLPSEIWSMTAEEWRRRRASGS